MDVVAPISAPMLQIVAIPSEGVGEKTTGSTKSEATRFLRSQLMEKTAKPREIKCIRHKPNSMADGIPDKDSNDRKQ